MSGMAPLYHPELFRRLAEAVANRDHAALKGVAQEVRGMQPWDALLFSAEVAFGPTERDVALRTHAMLVGAMHESAGENTLDSHSDVLIEYLKKHCEGVAAASGDRLDEVAREAGRAAIVMGCAFLGNALGLPADRSLCIAQEALRKFGLATVANQN